MKNTFVIVVMCASVLFHCDGKPRQSENLQGDGSELLHLESIRDAKTHSEEVLQEKKKQFYSCKPCQSDSDCGNGACISYVKISTKKRCGDDCQTANDCPKNTKPYFVYQCINNFCMSPEECEK